MVVISTPAVCPSSPIHTIVLHPAGMDSLTASCSFNCLPQSDDRPRKGHRAATGANDGLWVVRTSTGEGSPGATKTAMRGLQATGELAPNFAADCLATRLS